MSKGQKVLPEMTGRNYYYCAKCGKYHYKWGKIGKKHKIYSLGSGRFMNPGIVECPICHKVISAEGMTRSDALLRHIKQVKHNPSGDLLDYLLGHPGLIDSIDIKTLLSEEADYIVAHPGLLGSDLEEAIRYSVREDGRISTIRLIEKFQSRYSTNPVPMKGVGIRKFAGQTYYYAGRTIYPSKAHSVAQRVKSAGHDVKVTRSKGMGSLLWTSSPMRIPLGEVGAYGYYNPTAKRRTSIRRQSFGLLLFAGLIGYLIYRNR